jgi:hypothetical protein
MPRVHYVSGNRREVGPCLHRRAEVWFAARGLADEYVLGGCYWGSAGLVPIESRPRLPGQATSRTDLMDARRALAEVGTSWFRIG